MVLLPTVLASNAQISDSLPPNLVAVFAGATSGIGETTLKTLVRYAVAPKIYLFARSEASAKRVIADCKDINAKAEVIFVQADLRSIVQTDKAIEEVKVNEKTVNLVVLSAGEVVLGGKLTSEGLPIVLAAGYYSKLRIVQQLLPLLKEAAAASPNALSRVVVIVAGTKEGNVDVNDFPGLKLSFAKGRGHLTSMITLSLEKFAKEAPDVTFIHNFPGVIRTPLLADVGGILGLLRYPVSFIFWLGEVLGLPGHMRLPETGERHIFLATSAAYPPKSSSSGVALVDGVTVKRGIDGKEGSGVYSVDWDGESASVEVEALLVQLREKGVPDLVWDHTTGEFDRIIGAS